MKKKLIQATTAYFQQSFHKAPEYIFLSPGRINIIGEHVDYNDGFVLPAAINKYICFAISKNEKATGTIIAKDLNESYAFDWNADLKPVDKMWVNYILGVLQQLKACLEGVVERGTARSLKTEAYTMAGKTGTSLVADKGITYADHMYQSSFAGYFPASNPQFTIVVVIRNRAHAPKYYGGLVAGPVFREVADRLYAGHLYKPWAKSGLPDSSRVSSAGLAGTMKHVIGTLAMAAKDSMGNSMAGQLVTDEDYHKILKPVSMPARQMPALSGFGLKDALEVCEERGLMVTISGKGKVATQSIEAGRAVRKGQTVHLALN